jgi:hypothetical protein
VLLLLQVSICRVPAMRKITIAAALLAALAGTASAQQKKEDPYAAEDAAKARDAAILDKKYKTILKLTDTPTQVKVDPWQKMRGAGPDASKPKH